jgi:hypothetical protein
VALVVVAGSCGWAWWRITLPGRLAAATHARIRTGASLRDVMAEAEQYWDVTGSRCSGIESFQVFTPARIPRGSLLIRRVGPSGSADQEEVRFGNKPGLLRLFDERSELRSCRRLAFTFLVVGVPPRSSFAVELGEDGRVARVTEPRSWD